MGRPKTFERDDVLDAAIGVFGTHGFEGSSSGMLVEAMGIGRQSLYDTFGDKWALYRAAVERYAEKERGEHVAALRQGPRAIDGLTAMLARVVAMARQPCLGVSSVSEFGLSRDDLNDVRRTADQALRPAILEQIRAAQAEGDVAAQISADDAANFLIANFVGIRIAARGGADAGQLQVLADLALRALARP